jgi:CRP/FNR family cyclic AMP-dependent transcriptional regulator
MHNILLHRVYARKHMSMPLHEQIRLLFAVDIFEPLSPDEVESLAQRAPDVHLGEGEIFITPWDEGERLFVLKTGRVQLYRLSPVGEEITLSVVEAENIFGEMALTGQHLSGVHGRAMVPSVVCSLSRSDLEQIILRHPEVGLRLVRHLSRLLREAETRMAELITCERNSDPSWLTCSLIASGLSWDRNCHCSNK